MYRFTATVGDKRYQVASSPNSSNRKNLRLSTSQSPSSSVLYPRECQICDKFRVKYKNMKYEPYKNLTFNPEKSLKAAAKVKKEELFNEIKDIDLISKEFKVHKHCYKQFTHGFTSGL